ncbi:MAG: proline dehydrogenase family protein [Bacteroidales bacterium]|nr:proline dehydrogenase family protein [Bacteroidales bacterium]
MIDFENTRIAFRQKSNRQLRRAYWLFRMLARPVLVSSGSLLTRLAINLRLPVSWALKPTVFAHFCGGESIDDCDAVIRQLAEAGVQTILDYSAEGKEREADFDYTKAQIMATIDKAAAEKSIPYAVFKPTGLSRFALLEKLQSGAALNNSEKEEFARVKARFSDICTYAASRGVPVMIDSEESWIQGAVDELVEELMLAHNKKKPLVFNTLQMYRHDRLDYLRGFVRRAREQGVHSAFKLVRGAYMEKERERAKKFGYPSPIYPDKPATDAAFDEAVAFCLDNVSDVAVCVGTHNEASCEKAVRLMEQKGFAKNDSRVSFAQLLGMSDHISCNLAAAGYNVCKYVPYGPVKTVIPYLIRRAEENTSVAGQTTRELYLLQKEIRRRKAS